ncbi:aquaporin family protein [Streptomyces sp. WAC 00631]|uniref:MIP/aquaporin family protein n=1 Tax=unclassified Streptomyces TaxID=2593676 RepID=UPI000F7A9200|nr:MULTISPECIES: MIP/aquaporin family protein [unclassified Streptomyces]MCC5034179.1 aquaporin family protein [Streptomyces sp. WAC 00631]MCC9742438.1 aquaporin family protein [Streptomyces sp. MNU89]
MSSSDIFIGETIGTAVLILMGGGVVAAVTLKRSKALNAGWIAIALGWGFAVLTGAYIAVGVSGAHINPAVTLGLAIQGTTEWSDVPLYFASQMLGAMIGAALVWLTYYGHFRDHLTDPQVLAEARTGPEGLVEQDNAPAAGPVLGIFCTGPEIRNAVQNLMTETIATTVLVLSVLTLGLTEGLGVSGTGVLIVALVVAGIGFSLGGPTGYAINPARDLGPRIVHALLPLPNKGGSDWGYAWVPVVGPLLGGALAGGIYQLAFA